MYCRNCCNEVHEDAIYCVECGVPPLKGSNFCYCCGSETEAVAEICVNCGVSLVESNQSSGKDWLTTLLLCIFTGFLGVHRFYTGHIAIGVVQLLTFGGCWVWTIVDLILILTKSYKDTDGNELVLR